MVDLGRTDVWRSKYMSVSRSSRTFSSQQPLVSPEDVLENDACEGATEKS